MTVSPQSGKQKHRGCGNIWEQMCGDLWLLRLGLSFYTLQLDRYYCTNNCKLSHWWQGCSRVYGDMSGVRNSVWLQNKMGNQGMTFHSITAAFFFFPPLNMKFKIVWNFWKSNIWISPGKNHGRDGKGEAMTVGYCSTQERGSDHRWF